MTGPPLSASSGRIAALDGWRGIAILLVLIDHAQGAFLQGYAKPWTQTGQHGVTIFFVLSGYLITSKLLEGPINLKHFYIRRVLRLMPTAWSYLAAVCLIQKINGQPMIAVRVLSSCLFFYRNYMGFSSSVLTGHYWSLSMEEQFYLVWPALLLFSGIRKARWIALAGSLGCAVYRYLYWNSYNSNWPSFHTEVRADALLTGCLLALIFTSQEFRLRAVPLLKYLTLPLLAILLFCIGAYQFLPPLYECLAIAGLIALSVSDEQSILSRVLSWPALVWLGMVSYSVYVWQQPFFEHFGDPGVTATAICMMPFFALGSYYLIERPTTRMGHWLTRKTAQKPAQAIAQ